MEALVGLLVFLATLSGVLAARVRAPSGRLGYLQARRSGPAPDEPTTPRPVRVPWLQALEQEARQAGVGVAAHQLLLIAALAGAVAAVAGYAVTGRLAAGLVAAGLGAFAPRLWLARRTAARREAIARQLDGALERMASAMLAGQSLRQAIESTSAEVGPPLGDELRRAAEMLALAASPEAALRSVQERIGLNEFEQVVVAVAMQTQAGGNLAENFREIAEAVRDQRSLRADVIAATTEGRRSAWFVVGIAVLMVGGMALLNPGFFAPLLTMSFGRFALGFLGLMMVVGLLWVRKLMEVPWT